MRGLLAERRRQPREDMVTDLIAAHSEGERLSEQELVAMVANMLLGGHDTTKALISCMVHVPLQHPEQWRKLCEDPSLVPQAVEEVLRYESPVAAFPRVSTEEVNLDGIPLARGEFFIVSTLGANRDPARFKKTCHRARPESHLLASRGPPRPPRDMALEPQVGGPVQVA